MPAPRSGCQDGRGSGAADIVPDVGQAPETIVHLRGSAESQSALLLAAGMGSLRLAVVVELHVSSQGPSLHRLELVEPFGIEAGDLHVVLSHALPLRVGLPTPPPLVPKALMIST